MTQFHSTDVAAADMTAVNPPGVQIPGISQAMLVNQGKLLFLSGHVPIGSDGKFAAKNLETQLVQVLENIKLTLAAAGTDFNSVARVTIYVRNYQPSLLPRIREIRDRYVNKIRPPASALIGVAELFDPDALVEVDAVAIVP